MDAYTTFKFNFTFEIWIPVPSPDGATTGQTFYKNGSGLIAPGAAQTYLYTYEQVPYSSILKKVKDPTGKPIFEEFEQDVDRYISTSEPVFNYTGNVIGYRQILNRNAPYVYRGVDV